MGKQAYLASGHPPFDVLQHQRPSGCGLFCGPFRLPLRFRSAASPSILLLSMLLSMALTAARATTALLHLPSWAGGAAQNLDLLAWWIVRSGRTAASVQPNPSSLHTRAAILLGATDSNSCGASLQPGTSFLPSAGSHLPIQSLFSVLGLLC